MFKLLTTSVLAQNGFNIDSKNRIFRDKSGRHLMLHGVNAVYKIDPFIPSDGDFTPDTSLDDRDI